MALEPVLESEAVDEVLAVLLVLVLDDDVDDDDAGEPEDELGAAG